MVEERSVRAWRRRAAAARRCRRFSSIVVSMKLRTLAHRAFDRIRDSAFRAARRPRQTAMIPLAARRGRVYKTAARIASGSVGV